MYLSFIRAMAVFAASLKMGSNPSICKALELPLELKQLGVTDIIAFERHHKCLQPGLQVSSTRMLLPSACRIILACGRAQIECPLDSCC